jgi:8-oxo-dGTP diphosphatase
MNHLHENIVRTFGKRLRLRVCGICFQDDKLLLVRHKALGKKGYLLAPPGGGLQYGESAEACLVREFKEETGLDIKVHRFLFVHEFLTLPLHAIELFFEVEITGGGLTKGTDPEMGDENQIIDQVLYMSAAEIEKEKGDQLHNVLNLYQHPKELLNRQGYIIFHSKS